MKKIKRRSGAPIYLTVVKVPQTRQGALVATDEESRLEMRRRGYRAGDKLRAYLEKDRDSRFWRKVHKFGAFLAENLDRFEGMEHDAHKVIKTIQWEANLYCDEYRVNVPSAGITTIRIPQSLAYDEMDEGQFEKFFAGLSEHVRKTYWADMPDDVVQESERFMGLAN